MSNEKKSEVMLHSREQKKVMNIMSKKKSWTQVYTAWFYLYKAQTRQN